MPVSASVSVSSWWTYGSFSLKI